MEGEASIHRVRHETTQVAIWGYTYGYGIQKYRGKSILMMSKQEKISSQYGFPNNAFSWLAVFLGLTKTDLVIPYLTGYKRTKLLLGEA